MDPDLPEPKKETKKLFKNKKIQPHHHHISMLLIVVIFLIILLLIMIKPALLGYKVSSQFKEIELEVAEFMKELELTKSNLIITQTNLDSCKSLSKEYLENLAEEKNISFQCGQEKNELQSKYRQLQTEYTFNISKIKSEFEQKKNEIQINLTQYKTKYNELQSIYNEVVSNAVYNICCKAKVDNKDIDSYIISNGIIICTVGEEKKITC